MFKNVALAIEVASFLHRKHTIAKKAHTPRGVVSIASLSTVHNAEDEESYTVPGGLVGAWLVSLPILAVIGFAMYSVGLTRTSPPDRCCGHTHSTHPSHTR